MIEKDVAMQLKETYQRISQIMQSKIDEYDLSFGLLFLLSLIDKNPESSQKELAQKMRFTEGAMSTAVRKLLKLGMVRQEPLKLDMRYNRLVLTDKGKFAIEAYKDHLSMIHQDMFNGFKQDELEKLHDILLRINVNLNDIESKKSFNQLGEQEE